MSLTPEGAAPDLKDKPGARRLAITICILTFINIDDVCVIVQHKVGNGVRHDINTTAFMLMFDR